MRVSDQPETGVPVSGWSSTTEYEQTKIKINISSSQIVTTNIPTPDFYRPDTLAVVQPPVSKHRRKRINSDLLIIQAHLAVFQSLSLTTKSFWLAGKGCEASRQPSDASAPYRPTAGIGRKYLGVSP